GVTASSRSLPRQGNPMLAPHTDRLPAAPAPPAGGRRPWRWSQHWHDLLFAHWQVPAARLRRHLPAGLDLDTWEGTAWVSVVAFRLGVRLRGLPPLGPGSNFLELNLRTYARLGGEPGVFFLSIHAGSRVAV